jgi:hypothetical protein
VWADAHDLDLDLDLKASVVGNPSS